MYLAATRGKQQMTYKINDGSLPETTPIPERRGRKAAYPLKDLAVGQWISVPRAEEFRLYRAVKHAQGAYNMRFQVMSDITCENWVVMRTQ